ncbi:MAG TPA: TorF family putative porin [Steroidobacteraceae bacterium]|nr:TorF family putative porin [Steroidobacteraceae bacterium]
MNFIRGVVLALISLSAQAELPGKLYPSVSLTSDYRYNGVSYSGRGPAPQASLHWLGAGGWYAGAWTSAVDFDDPGNTSIEADLYAGRARDFAGTRIAGEVLYTFFPDKTFRGPTYDFLQLKARVSRSFEVLTIGALAAWTPEASYRSGTAWRVAVDAAYAFNGAFEASANAGRRWVGRGVDRSFWDAGVTATWQRLALDVRYVDTNLDERDCGFSRRCSATVVATLTLRFW